MATYKRKISFKFDVSESLKSGKNTKFPIQTVFDSADVYVFFMPKGDASKVSFESKDFCAAYLHIKFPQEVSIARKQMLSIRFYTMSGSLDKTTKTLASTDLSNGWGYSELLPLPIPQQDQEIHVDLDISDGSGMSQPTYGQNK